MNGKSIYISILILFFSFGIVYSKDYDPDYVERIFESISPETEVASQIDLLEQFIENPIELNNASVSDVFSIPGFTYSLSLKITDFIKEHKDFNYNMLADSLNIDEVHFYLLRLCTYIKGPYSYEHKKNFYLRLRNEQSLNDVKGFRDSSFTGSPLNLYQRISAYYHDFSLGGLLNKDAGERYIADFYSGYIAGQVGDTKFIVGDFSINAGMGSIIYNSIGFGKSAEVISPTIPMNNSINPYISSIESHYFRGTALKNETETGRHSKIITSIFFSGTKKAATVDTGSIVTSLYNNDFFRTHEEISRKDVLFEKAFGGSAEWQQEHFSSGITLLYLDYNKEIQSESKTVFFGKSGLLSSLYSFITLKNTLCGLEISRDANGNIGFKSGLQYDNKSYELALYFRSFNKDFRSPYGYDLCSGGNPSNETGLYGACKWKSSRTFNITAYFDFYRSNTRTYLIPMPIHGLELFSEADWFFLNKFSLTGRLEYNSRTDTYTYTEEIPQKKQIYQKSRYSARIELKNSIKPGTYVRLRAEASYTAYEDTHPEETGLASFFEFSWLVFSNFRLGGRVTYFNTPSYETAIWQFEPALPGYITVPPLYGQGLRSFVNVSYSPFENITLSIRYAVTSKNNVKSLGTGLTEILGNEDKRFLMQLDVEI